MGGQGEEGRWWLDSRGGYNSDDITKVGVRGGGGGLLSQEAVMTE